VERGARINRVCSSCRTKLLVSSHDHHLYIFDCIVPETEPVIFSGHVHGSFYVKSCFSPDGRYEFAHVKKSTCMYKFSCLFTCLRLYVYVRTHSDTFSFTLQCHALLSQHSLREEVMGTHSYSWRHVLSSTEPSPLRNTEALVYAPRMHASKTTWWTYVESAEKAPKCTQIT